MKGVYTLLIELDVATEIKTIGRKFTLKTGFYAYVGSALNNLEARIARHLSHDKKRHWHIDYFLEHAQVKTVISAQTEMKVECQIARRFTGIENVPGFGCGDCNCPSHLFYSKNKNSLRDKTVAAYTHLGLDQSEMLI